MKFPIKKLFKAFVLIAIITPICVLSFLAVTNKLTAAVEGGAYLDDPAINTPDIYPLPDSERREEEFSPDEPDLSIGETPVQNPPSTQVSETPTADIDQPPAGIEPPIATEQPPAEPETPIIKEDLLLKSLINSLNIRSGPGTGYASLGSIDAGDIVPYIAAEGAKWYKTFYKGKTAYISSAYTSVIKFKKAEERIEKVIEEAKKLLGYPYVYGAQRYHWGAPGAHLNPNFVMGLFDCSSFTQYAFYKGAGIALNTTTRTQVAQGVPVEKIYLKRGDLLFFTNASRSHLSGVERIGHVAIYLGNNYIIHTASDYAVIEQISASRWNNYITARRVIS